MVDGAKVLSKVKWRLIPFMVFLYILNYLDRVNVAFAKLQMGEQLNIDDAMYGSAVAAFYVGYCLFEVPSNLIMERVGARVWIARIMISWGAISAAMMFIGSANSFYWLRLSLGAAEAGFFPGMILYLSYWIPARERAQAAAMFLTSTALSGAIGGPLAGIVLDRMSGLGGLAGWQWLFLIEGSLTVIVGVFVLFYLTNKPKDAHWLTVEERTWLEAEMAREQAPSGHEHAKLGQAFTSGRVWYLCFLYGALLFGFYSVHYWAPSLLKEASTAGHTHAALSDLDVSLLVTIPAIAAAIGMVLIGRSSDRHGTHHKHAAFSAFIGACGFLMLSMTTDSTALTVVGLSIAAVGAFGTLGPVWALPPIFLRGSAAAAGIALINSVGNFVGGYIGPTEMGKLKKQSASYATGMQLTAAVMALGVIMCLCIAFWFKSKAQPVTAAAKVPESAGV